MAQRDGPRSASNTPRVLAALVCCMLLLLAAGGVAYRLGWADDLLGRQQSQGAAAQRAELPPMRFVPLPAPRAVLEPVETTAAGPRPRAVSEAVEHALAAPALGSHVGLVVRDLTHSRTLLNILGTDRFVPASTAKLFTVAATLGALEPGTRFRTRVVSTSDPRRIVLVGGGDPLLTRRRPAGGSVDTYPHQATLSRLAASTARELHHRGVTSISLRLDATLFAGPTASPSWEPSYIGDVVSPVTALEVDEGRVRGSSRPSADPVRDAGAVFAAGLRSRGIAVRGVPRPGRAGHGAQTLASVRSAPVGQIAEHVLAVSDNDAAEVLLRQVALAQGQSATFDGGVRAVHGVLTRLGLDVSRVTLHDGSGLSRRDRVPLSALMDLVDLASRRPRLRPLLTDLPVAGFSGSLGYRFEAQGSEQARGLLRAKTGTLSHVVALAGSVRDRSGAVLAFALAADRVRLADTLAAHDAVDRVGSALAGCGCH